MAACAVISLSYTLQKIGLGRTVGFMAVKAAHSLLPYWMMGKKTELGLDIRMATITELSHLVVADPLLRPFVQLMAGETTQIIEGMHAGMPVGQ